MRGKAFGVAARPARATVPSSTKKCSSYPSFDFEARAPRAPPGTGPREPVFAFSVEPPRAVIWADPL